MGLLCKDGAFFWANWASRCRAYIGRKEERFFGPIFRAQLLPLLSFPPLSLVSPLPAAAAATRLLRDLHLTAAQIQLRRRAQPPPPSPSAPSSQSEPQRRPRRPPPPAGPAAPAAPSPDTSCHRSWPSSQGGAMASGIMFRRLSKTLTMSPATALASGMTSQHHQLQQRAPVSGTSKGKAKLKAGMPLRRSVIAKKGGAPATAGSGGAGRGRREAMERITQIAESCLKSSTPLRHLSPKERLREAKREELGLISKERQRELDAAKAKAKAKSKGASGGDGDRVLMGPPGLDYISLGLVDEEAIPEYELTVEDGRRLAKEYSRVLMRRHRARQTAESTLLRLKKEAIAALPEKLRAAAMVPDMTPFPANRYMATLTPPIEGYIEKVRDAAKKYSVKEKLR
ncbi:uncharacterized protein LOC125553096 [Triticum urartu]|nr:uncharacterized protein LOC125553096 [Triticum urartu]